MIESTATSTMILGVKDSLFVWQDNPRVSPNAHYQEIAADIVSHGYKGVLAVTQPPHSEFYVPRFGGNTRVAVLRELAESDPALSVTVSIHPWPGEAVMLRDAIAENTNRGSQSVLDEALAVCQLLDVPMDGQGHPSSVRSMVEQLSDMGLRYSRPKLQSMLFVTTRLAPLVGVDQLRAMHSGQGPSSSDIKSLIALIEEFELIWREHRVGSDEGFQQTLEHCLMNCEPFSVPGLNKALTLKVGQSAKDEAVNAAMLRRTTPDIEKSEKTRCDLAQLVTVVTTQLGIGDCIVVDERSQLGFQLTLPATAVEKTEASHTWWMLCGLSQQLNTGADTKGAQDDSTTPLRQLIDAGRVDEIFQRVGRPPAIHQFFGGVSDLRTISRMFSLAAGLRSVPIREER